jgi:hypothetical protein
MHLGAEIDQRGRVSCLEQFAQFGRQERVLQALAG